jgi:hypothetical protein
MHQGINLCEIARDLLERRLYTTKSLGDAIGLSQPSVSRLASGKTKEIGAYPALKLIELAGGTVKPPAAPAAEPLNQAAQPATTSEASHV